VPIIGPVSCLALDNLSGNTAPASGGICRHHWLDGTLKTT